MRRLPIVFSSLLLAGGLAAAEDNPWSGEPKPPADEPQQQGERRRPDGPRQEAHDAMPAGTKGVSEGVIRGIEKGRLVLVTEEGALLFMPHWRGGMPKDGGGLDKDMLRRLEAFKAGQRVRIAWTWEERRRIESIEAVAER